MFEDSTDCTVENVDDLLRLVAPRSDSPARELILRAYEFAAAKHAGQLRTSGEPYITHPLTVAGLLGCLNMDASTVAAALLHDVVEDCGVSLDELRAGFGVEIATLVDAVTKLSKREGLTKEVLQPAPGAPGSDPRDGGSREARPGALSDAMAFRTNREAESLRKMFLGITRDVRVVLIKLADRLHNMRTLHSLKPEKRRRIARETLTIFAPLANRLGMWEWKQELEDLGFKYAEPDIYHDLSQRLEEGAADRTASVQRQIERLREALAERGIMRATISGRAKQIYSIWRKMQRKKCTFDQIMDLRAIRVIVEDEDGEPGQDYAELVDETQVDAIADGSAVEPAAGPADSARDSREQRRRDLAAMHCYNVLYVVHNLWKPMASEFDDYISKPKDNHYRSLHTAVIVDDGRPLEVQIRTRSMHRSAEFGVAAHWLYKEQALLSADYQKYLDAWREDLRALSTAEEDASDFVSAAVRESALDDNIYCFTPKGRLIELPRGATVLDFAFHVHTDLGYKCRGAHVNGRFVPITHKLNNDDQIEILTRPDGAPSRDWLLNNESYCTTSSARTKIKLYFKRLDRPHNIADGREAIERELRRLSAEGEMKIEDVLRLYDVDVKDSEKVEDFLSNVGAGTVTLQSVGSRILVELNRREREKQSQVLGGWMPMPQILRRNRGARPLRKAGFCLRGAWDIPADPSPCCNPLPGDDVIGYVTVGQGVRVHRRDCANLSSLDPNRFTQIDYIGEREETYPIQFVVSAVDRPGLLNEVSGVLSDNNINITEMQIINRNKRLGETSIWFKVELRHADEAMTLMTRLQRIRNVFDVRRVTSARQR